MNKIIIAIDGHSSTGKSTLAKMLSKYLKYKHINTGSMYRAITLNAIENGWINDSIGIKSVNKSLIIKSLDSLEFNFLDNDKNEYSLYLNGKNIDSDIKEPLVSKYVSIVSAYSLIRNQVVKIQQKIGKNKAVVMEGRDIASVVFPNAELKLFVTASIEIRAQRRYKELISMGIKANFDNVLENLEMRDKYD